MTNWEYGKVLTILRGISGSGKTFLANKLDVDIRWGGVGPVVHCSADHYFLDENLNYKFNPTKLGEAHAYCRGRVSGAMSANAPAIIVDNTNTTSREWAPYLLLAKKFGYQVEFKEPDTPWKFDVDELTKRNTHGVPRETIEKMLKRWEPTPQLVT